MLTTRQAAQTLRSFRNPTALCLAGCDRRSQRKWLSGNRRHMAKSLRQRHPEWSACGQRNSRFLALSFRTRKVAFGSRSCENMIFDAGVARQR
jgi:hypothetical protein